MSSKSKLKKSRKTWKGKAITRGQGERYQRKENLRIKKERDRYKQEAREAKKQLEKELLRNATPVCNKENLVYVSLKLFLVANIGFRAVSRVLGVLADYLGIAKAPCTQTIINWVTRLSITRIQNFVQPAGPRIGGNPFSNGFIWMIDTSIGLGSGKILTVLALNANHHALSESAPTLQKVNCIAVAVAASWTGETIADFLQKVIATTGRPAAYLKDGGTDLAKAVRLLAERDLPGLCIDDISHTIANLLKHEYQNHPLFETFMSACGKTSKRFKQTILACLAPPKVSTKARFMNLHRLVKWAGQVLRHSPRGRAPENSTLSKLRAGIGQIPECKAFISRFLRDANPLLASQKILKTKGFSQDSYRECRKLVETIPPRSPVRTGFINWMEKQLMLAVDLGLENTGMPISSDNIESLFGVSKQHGTGEVKDANRIALRIPAMCGELTRKDAQMVLDISVKEQQEIVATLPSLTRQRRDLLPNPGCLDEVLTDETKKNLELIPRSKKRSKNLINLNIAGCYGKMTGTLIDSQKRATPLPKLKISKTLA
ncbi:MAG: hypothetical protein JRI32_08750 [Deltaproteobacteria bacterium]|nr:hypothetical protein [Deltaproteobacteria bacterium]MBW2011708.1 hypothetical protein [Deltaproteobacteria bacterium]